MTLGIENSDELKKVYQQYQYTFGKQANIIVQKEISGGTEMIVGSTFQPGLGHLVKGNFLWMHFWLLITPGFWIGTGGIAGFLCHIICAYQTHLQSNK